MMLLFSREKVLVRMIGGGVVEVWAGIDKTVILIYKVISHKTSFYNAGWPFIQSCCRVTVD